MAKATVCKTVILRFKSGCRLHSSSRPILFVPCFPRASRLQTAWRRICAGPKKQPAPLHNRSAGFYAKLATTFSSSRLSLFSFLPSWPWSPSFHFKGPCAGNSPANLACTRRAMAGVGFGAATSGGRFLLDVPLQLIPHDSPVVSYLECRDLAFLYQISESGSGNAQ